MPSFDVVSEIDMAEMANALLMARKELASRFDFKGVEWEITEEKDKLIFAANDQFKLDALREIVIGKLAKRGIPLKNLETKDAELLGLRVETVSGHYVGTIHDVVQTPAHEVLEIDSPSMERVLVPLVDELVTIDVEAGVARVIDGLLDLGTAPG